ncbi:MAG TPA: hypothetical protein VG758_19460 [Hyphomicrobiaceae bacterium]|nr:hypothetical protein [Hyphomicrobiaceae bacterium]
MPNATAAWGLVFALGLTALGALSTVAPAQNATVSAAAAETEEEKKDRLARRACAVSVCAVLHNRTPAAEPIACNLQKTWRKEVVTKILARGKVSWPWGDTRCGSEVKLDRALLIKAMQEPEFEAQFDTYNVRCQIENAKDTYDVSVALRPKVTFKQGKATKASLNWGKIEAPALAKGALWSITAADNTFGLFQSMAVNDINDFIGTKCMEAKEEWQGK